MSLRVAQFRWREVFLTLTIFVDRSGSDDGNLGRIPGFLALRSSNLEAQ
ncbi:hypothetical protein H6F89_23670 [Cyanobacteria bacterium FACHB-63]|nr:hypothetical protein [Cyanobacteria bacterium FACHB-63]